MGHSLKKGLPKAYCSATASTIEDAQKLIESGFEYVTEIDREIV